jgi:hypothetical protein
MSKTATKSQLTREEEMLIQDYSRNVSIKSSALFYGNAAIVAAVPICNPRLIFIFTVFKIQKLIKKSGTKRALLENSPNGTGRFLYLLHSGHSCCCLFDQLLVQKRQIRFETQVKPFFIN